MPPNSVPDYFEQLMQARSVDKNIERLFSQLGRNVIPQRRADVEWDA